MTVSKAESRAVLLTLILAGLLAVQCANPPAHKPVSAPVSLTPTATLDPGTHFLANPDQICTGGCSAYRRIIFTLPAGWALSNGLVYKHLNQPGEVALSAWTVGQVYNDPCHWQGSALSPLDITHVSGYANGAVILATYEGGLAHQALRGPLPRALTQLNMAGVDGSGASWPANALRIDLSVPADLDISMCDEGQFRSWTEWNGARGANSHHAAGQLDAVYMVGVDRRPLVIDGSQMPATSASDLAELKAILGSMIIDRG